jgi:hypothetical protein
MLTALLVALVPALQDSRPPAPPDEPEFVSQVPS